MGEKMLTLEYVQSLIPRRPHDSHKGVCGRVGVIGGATGMLGAPLLAARAALHMGAGCVYVGLLSEQRPFVDMLQPELMLHSAQDILQHHVVDVWQIGCGMGRSQAAQNLLEVVLQQSVPVILDADALNILAMRTDLCERLNHRTAASILTPHPGEAARLLHCQGHDIQQNRLLALQKLAEKFPRSGIVLKGANSLCVTSQKNVFVNPTGNQGMSTAGMGDVLAGMMAGFMAQNICSDDVVLLATYLHGYAGNALSEKDIFIGMTASELFVEARLLLNRWQRSTNKM